MQSIKRISFTSSLLIGGMVVGTQDARADITCANGSQCELVEQDGNGTGILAYSPSNTSNAAISVNAPSAPGIKVLVGGSYPGIAVLSSGNNGSSPGISSEGTSGDGVEGFTSAANRSGLYGHNDGSSVTGWGVYGYSAGIGPGTFGGSHGGDGVEGFSSTAGRSGVYGHNNASGGNGVYGGATGTGHAIHGVNTNSGGWAGYFVGPVFSTVGYTSSDARLKTDIKASPYGLEQLLKLRPVTYHWRAGRGPDGPQLGLIAQEVQKIIPELVNNDAPTDTLSINYTGLLPVVIKGLQEQKQLIDAQQTAAQRQLALIEQLQSRVRALEGVRRPILSSFLPSDATGVAALGSLPLLVLVEWRRRRAKS